MNTKIYKKICQNVKIERVNDKFFVMVKRDDKWILLRKFNNHKMALHQKHNTIILNILKSISNKYYNIFKERRIKNIKNKIQNS